MHDPERDIRDIPLSQLELSPDNVRKTPADASAFTELKASIAAHGLLENLIARSMGPSPDGAGRYAVIAGGRRLAAMQALAAEGALDEDHPVPCRMIGSIVAAEEVSLAENSVRAAMHPADQVEAFRRLADAGSTAVAIAARFGISERTVEKRLRLGNAAPVLLEAYRAGEIDLDTLMAFAVTTDRARQSVVWETVSQQGYARGPRGGWTVRIGHPGPLPRLADLFREAAGLAGVEITTLDLGADGGWRLHGRPVAPEAMTRAGFREPARALASNSQQFPNEEATHE